ncbi:Crp/Fnr family transcriptional regulator [Croceicoccus ponticola]|uniref:Crp/Fnr family transcriptional regulator n=1 Tax=Croceicoccus ponticola TaxID=2217664 RepID=A0A437H0Z6_9SPHN|nr:Crp/Fnr family transcriptional regulator [Croceicoccus ponticola]RVQ69317.1 Crp/Fnr family transcriptional regulator [Croceicoccus ponticola]
MSIAEYPRTGRFMQGRLRHAMQAREMQLLEDMVEEVELFTSSQAIIKRGQIVERSTMLIDGYIARIIMRGGKRHIVGIHVPGDFVDLHGFALKKLDHDIVTIGHTLVGYVPHPRLVDVMKNEPHLARLLWFATLLDAANHREWILKLEMLHADGRLAHLVAELWHRLDFVGLAEPQSCAMPLTQVELADACGTTAIHMNRTVRAMREAGLLDFARGRVTIPDMAKLKALGQFDTSYLYGNGELFIGKALDKM